MDFIGSSVKHLVTQGDLQRRFRTEIMDFI